MAYRRNKDAGSKNNRKVKLPALPAESARALKRRLQPRGDTTQAMQRLLEAARFSGAWDYNDEVSQMSNTHKHGYYICAVAVAHILPEDAMELFCEHNYDEGQRRLDEAWARTLATDVATVHNIAYAIGPDGLARCVNGQHSIWAIYQRGELTQASVTFYMCRDRAAVADLYSTFDYNKRRTYQQALHAASNAGNLVYTGSPRMLAKWAACVAVAENDFSRKNLNREGRGSQMERAKREDVQEFAKFMDGYVTDSIRKRLVNQGIGAAFFAMWQSDLDKTIAFAHSYFSGENLSNRSPVLVMRNAMISRRYPSNAIRDHVEVMYSAWKKFCNKESMQYLRRTGELPAPAKWRIFESSTTAMVTLGGLRHLLTVPCER